MEGHHQRLGSVEERSDDEMTQSYHHDTRGIDHRPDMFNMSRLGQPFIPLNTPNQLLQPVNTRAESVPTVSINNPSQAHWLRGRLHGKARSVRCVGMSSSIPGDRQLPHASYANPVSSGSMFVGNYYDPSHQSSRVPYSSAMLQQVSVSGQNSGLPLSFPGDGSLQRNEHRTLVDPLSATVQQSNAWLPLIPTQPRGRHHSLNPYRSTLNDHSIPINPGAPATFYPQSYVSQNMSPSQYASCSQSPWSSDNTRIDRDGSMLDCALYCDEAHETFSGLGSSRAGGGAILRTGECDSTTLVSSYNQDADVSSGVDTLFSNSSEWKVPDALSNAASPLTYNHGHGQHEGCHHVEFQLQVREGTPRLNEYGGDISSRVSCEYVNQSSGRMRSADFLQKTGTEWAVIAIRTAVGLFF